MKQKKEIKSARASEPLRNNKVPKATDEQNELAHEMHDYYFDPKHRAIDISTFPINHRFAPSKFFRIAETNEHFADILEQCRKKIALNLINLIRDDPEHKSLYNKLLPLYHEEFREYEMARRFAFDKKMAEANGKITIETICGNCMVKDTGGKKESR